VARYVPFAKNRKKVIICWSAGAFLCSIEVFFDYLSADDKSDLEIGPLEKIASEGQLMVYKHNGFWACMDTLRDMESLNRLWDENRAEWKIWE